MARPPPGSGQPPVSFKTVPGRNRTQKWNTARTYDYSGGDWGGYDPYDDYGDYDEGGPPPMPGQNQPPLPTPIAQYQQPPYGAQQYPRPGRQQSFDEGDERRAFSGLGAFPGARAPSGSPARSAVSSTSGNGRISHDQPRPSTAGRARDFTNPEQVPPPLSMRQSPAPGTVTGGYIPPPRKSSMSAGSPASDVIPMAAKKDEKELPTIPFVRPSDIYKRMAEEKEKERKSSMDSTSRPSMDQLGVDNSARSLSQQRPLSSVYETPAIEDGPSQTPAQSDAAAGRGVSPSLPPVESFGGFGGGMFSGGSSSRPATATDTRAPPGSDPAADTLAERTHDVHVLDVGKPGTMPSRDPAADILAERTHDVPVADVGKPGTVSTHDPAASILAERMHDVPVSDVGRSGTVSYDDPAASILAERTHDIPVSHIGRQPDSLSHQPSSGYRSMVNQAFDASDARKGAGSIPASFASRDTLDTDVSRSNTTSTSNTGGISPIMARVPPFASTDQMITEESPRASIQAGYRRSLDPPSHDNSPARTPGLEDASRGRSLSGGFAAETVDEALGNTTGRPRAGTDYSVREADLAREVNASPEQAGFAPETAARERESQDQFLQNSDPASPTVDPMSATRSSSPSKSRVRQLAEKYDDTSRRNSQTSLGATSRKSSWSNFRGSDENLAGRAAASAVPQRHDTGASNVTSESDYGGVEEGGLRDSPSAMQADNSFSGERPGMGRDMSFRPHMPGEWVSTSNVLSRAETPAPTSAPTRRAESSLRDVVPADHTPRASGEMPVATEPIDLTPTTRKFPLRGYHQNDMDRSHHDSAPRDLDRATEPIDLSPSTSRVVSGSRPPDSNENVGILSKATSAGTALGASLMAQMGQGHQTRDFGSAQPAQQVEVPGERHTSGEMGWLRSPERPGFARGETDASMMSDVTAVSNETASMAPTPAGEDGQQYFAVAPLRTRETSPDAPPAKGSLSSFYNRPQEEGLHRDDSTLRREIVRSLDGSHQDESANRDVDDDVARTQDALDAPDNLARLERGEPALPGYEMKDDSPSKPKPLLLDQRFSWEKREEGRGVLATPEKPASTLNTTAASPMAPPPAVPRVQEPDSLEIKPEAPYERPRSRGLHIMNADGSDSEDEWNRDSPAKERAQDGSAAERWPETGLAVGAAGLAAVGLGAAGVATHRDQDRLGGESAAGSGLISPMTKSQENLRMGDLGVPSPPSEAGRGSPRLPSYYFEDAPGLELAPTQTRDGTLTATVPIPIDDDSTAARDLRPTFSTSASDTTIPPPPPPHSPSAPGLSPTTPTSKPSIPPFRNILALKNPDARIRTYNDTRQTFADMHTGLSDWVAGMVESNPEYANLTNNPQGALPPALQTSGTLRPGHRASPSIAKFAPRFGGASDAPQRSQSVSAGAADEGKAPVDIEKLQQRGKAVMKGAGVLGGKAQAGAKGLLAKGRSRFGTQRGRSEDKVPPVSSSNATSDFNLSRSTTPAPELQASQQENQQQQQLLAPTPSPIPSNLVFATSALAPAPTAQSVPSRSQTQTPSSLSISTNSHSRPLSRTFSRLRESSRSLSRSLSRTRNQSKSRPSSLLLTTTDTNPGLGALEDASPANARDTTTVVTGGGCEEVISPWDEPSRLDLDRMELGESRSATPARLGVLPSPTVGSFSMDAEVDDDERLDGDEEEPRTPDPVTDHEKKYEATQTVLPVSGYDKEDEAPQTAFPASAEDDGAPETAFPLPEGEEHMTVDHTNAGNVSSAREEMDEVQRHETSETTNSDDGGRNEEDDDPRQTTPVASRKVAYPDAVTDESDQGAQETTPTTAVQDRGIYGLQPATGQDGEVGSRRVDSVGAAQVLQSNAGVDDEPMIPSTGSVVQSDAETNVDTTSLTIQNKELSPLPIDKTAIHEAGLHEQTGTRPALAASIVSSKDGFQDAQEGTAPASFDDMQSRRSSVSSLDADQHETGMSSRAVPAGPIFISQRTSAEQRPAVANRHVDPQGYTNQGDSFMNRNYLFGGEPPSRSPSYIELGTDSTGAPRQETLDMANTSSAGMNISGMSAPLPGTPPFRPHPAERSPTSPDAGLKRRSAVVRGRRTTLTSPVIEPSPNQITDHYGLEGLHDSASIVAGDRSSYHEREIVEPERRRRSGLWDALKRTPSRSRVGTTKEPSSNLPAAQQDLSKNVRSRATSHGRQESPKSGTLKKPQRASTTAEPETKKKRFSSLGSLFGRSSTTSKKSEKTGKLTKTQTTKSETPEMETFKTAQVHNNREGREYQLQDVPPPIPNAYRGNDRAPQQTSQESPPGGWYGPLKGPASGPPPHIRQLHSQGRRQSSAPVYMPEPYESIEESYNSRSTVPVGPYQAGSAAAFYPLPSSQAGSGTPSAQRPYGQRPPIPQSDSSTSSQRRHSSYTDTYQLSPQVSGQSEWARSGAQHRGSSSSVSPIQARRGSDAFPPKRNYRVGSISEEISRPPPGRAMPDQQQPPYLISLPSDLGQGRDDFHSGPWLQEGIPKMPTARSYPIVEESYVAQPGPAAYAPRQASNWQQPQTRYYHQTNDGYADTPPAVPPKLPQDEAPALATNFSRRTSTGFAGPRNGPRVGDDPVEMKGVSYPGQEWQPDRWD